MRDDDTYDDEDDAPPPRSEPRPPARRMTPFRFITPGTFGIGVVLFFLPWTDLSCDGPTGRMQLVTQSGYESAVGEATEGNGFAKLREAGGPMAGGKLTIEEMRKAPMQKGLGGKEKADEKAPLLWVYLGLLVLGAVVPVLLADAQIRGAIVVGFATFAALLLILQLVLGFPLATTAADFNKEVKQKMDVGKNVVGPEAMFGKMEMKTGYLPSFWGSVALLVASGVLGVVQMAVGGPPGGRGGRSRRPRDDPDEE